MLLVYLLALIPFGIVIFKEVRFLVRVRGCTELRKGIVTRLDEKYFFGRASHRSTFIPSVRYEYDGETHESASGHSYYYDVHTVDGEVWIYVNPDVPGQMILADERKTAVGGIMTAILLAGVIVVYAAILAAKYKL